VGIDDHTLDNSVTVFPNPTTGGIQLHCSDNVQNIEVYDAFGKLLDKVDVNANSSELDLSGLATGTYFLRVTTEKGVVTKRIVRL
jgi:hypothetical protein